MRRLLLPLAVFLSGCGREPGRFPVGMFGVVEPAEVALLRGEGFDAIQTYETAPEKVAPLAAAAKRRRIMLLASPHEIMVRHGRASDFPGVVWYLQDEPDVHGVSAQRLRDMDRAAKEWAPAAATAFVVGDGRRAKEFPGAGDAIMVDWYPVPHLPLESAGDHVRMTAEAAGGREVWAVLQAMDWRHFPQRDPKKPRIGRFPDLAEIRFMTYDAVLNGATGVWYFVYTIAPGINLSASPELLFAVTQPAKEMRAMAPVFSQGRPIPLPFPPEVDGAMARAWTYRGRDYVVLENRRRDRAVEVPAALLSGEWRPLFEAKRDVRELLAARDGEALLPPYRVLVLESRLRLSRLLGR